MLVYKHKQQGLTLIELLISLAVGVIVSIVGVQLFTTGLSSFTLQKGLGDVNDSGRFGLEFLAKNIQPSGYAMYTNTYMPVVMDAGQIPGGTEAMVSRNNTFNIGLGQSDQLVIRTWVPSTVEQPRDCEGNLVPNTTNDPGVFMIARYFLRNDTQTNSVALVCDAGSYTEDAASITDYDGDTETAGTVLMSFVESFQVLYGITTDATSMTPMRFVTSAEYTGLASPPRIVAVRVGTLVRSAEKAGNLPSAATPINLLGEEITADAQNTAESGVIRRQFVKTVALRNS